MIGEMGNFFRFFFSGGDGSLFCWVLGNEREGWDGEDSPSLVIVGQSVSCWVLKGGGEGLFPFVVFEGYNLFCWVFVAGFCFRVNIHWISVGRASFTGYWLDRVGDSPLHRLLKRSPSFFVFQSSLLGVGESG